MIEYIKLIWLILKNIIPIVISIFWVRFSQKIEYIKELNSKGEYTREYHLLISLQNEILMDSEKLKLNLCMAKLFYDVGNYRRFLALMDEISVMIDKYPKEIARYGLLKSFSFEIKGDLAGAVLELEKVYENTSKNIIKIQAYNNIARLQEMQGNFTSTQIFYEKSFKILFIKPIAELFPIVVHNLLIRYAKNSEKNKADELLKVYWTLIDKRKVKEILDYANGLIGYARQIDDRNLLIEAHKIVDEKVYAKINDFEKFALDISRLRMNYNDNLNFEEQYKKVFNTIKLKEQFLSLNEKLIVIKELKHILIQHIKDRELSANIMDDFNWLTKLHLSLENEILSKLTETESSLSNIRIQYLKELIELEKIKIASLKESEDYLPYLKKVIQYIEETILIYKDSENVKQQINMMINLLDEINSYYMQSRERRLLIHYRDMMLKNFIKAELLLEENWRQAGVEEYMIAIAWLSLQIKQDKDLALKWIDRFDKLNHSVNHYTEYVKQWYFETKKYLEVDK